MFLRTCNKNKKVFSFLYHVNISILFCSFCSWFFKESHSDSIRTSEKAGKDPKTCEILVDNVESKDLGAWRSNFTIDSVAWSSKLSRCFVRRKCAWKGSRSRRKCAKIRGRKRTITVRETPGIFHTDQWSCSLQLMALDRFKIPFSAMLHWQTDLCLKSLIFRESRWNHYR